jgi:CO/xanthine dehydrogenase FAD-binding subunit
MVFREETYDAAEDRIIVDRKGVLMLSLPEFDYYEPKEMEEACKLLWEMKSSGKIIAGGTDILVHMKRGQLTPKFLVSVARIRGLAEIEQRNGTISIGSQVIVTRLMESDLIRKRYSLLSQAASVLGSPLIRNRATVGGNLVSARPAADLPPPLLAMGAKVTLRNREGEREVLLDDFFLGPGQTVLKSHEILTKIAVREAPPFTGGSYEKLMQRKSLEIAIVAVASKITLDKPDGVIREAKVILSAVALRAMHALSAEEILVGERPTVRLLEKAAMLAGADCTPITDIRGGADYRRAMVEVLTKRTLERALKSAQRESRES